jgi:hypothetical protein
MNRTTSSAIMLIALLAFLPGVHAQNAYRCGNSYSQTPCPGGVPVAADDSRSKAQKAQSESVIKRDLRTGEAMEKSRLQQEEAQKRTAQLPAEKPVAKSTTTEPGKPTQSTKKRSRAPEYFTAKTQGDKKKKKNETAAPAGSSTGNTSTAK